MSDMNTRMSNRHLADKKHRGANSPSAHKRRAREKHADMEFRKLDRQPPLSVLLQEALTPEIIDTAIAEARSYVDDRDDAPDDDRYMAGTDAYDMYEGSSDDDFDTADDDGSFPEILTDNGVFIFMKDPCGRRMAMLDSDRIENGAPLTRYFSL